MMVGEIINAMAGQELQTPIEIALRIDEKGMTTAKRLYEFLELNPRNYSHWCKRNILENEFAEEKVDFWAIVVKDERNFNPKPTQDFKLTAHFAKKLSMKGSGERAEQAREYFSRLDEKMKEIAIDQSKLSPQLRYLISMELKQRQQDERIRELESRIEQQDALLKNMRSRKTENTERDTTRRWALRSIGQIAESPSFNGIYNRYQKVYWESYERLEEKTGCDLEELVKKAREKARKEGATKTRIKNISRQEIIAADEKLRESYASVIRDMLLAYCGKIPKAGAG